MKCRIFIFLSVNAYKIRKIKIKVKEGMEKMLSVKENVKGEKYQKFNFSFNSCNF